MDQLSIDMSLSLRSHSLTFPVLVVKHQLIKYLQAYCKDMDIISTQSIFCMNESW